MGLPVRGVSQQSALNVSCKLTKNSVHTTPEAQNPVLKVHHGAEGQESERGERERWVTSAEHGRWSWNVEVQSACCGGVKCAGTAGTSNFNSKLSTVTLRPLSHFSPSLTLHLFASLPRLSASLTCHLEGFQVRETRTRSVSVDCALKDDRQLTSNPPRCTHLP